MGWENFGRYELIKYWRETEFPNSIEGQIEERCIYGCIMIDEFRAKQDIEISNSEACQIAIDGLDVGGTTKDPEVISGITEFFGIG